MKSKFIAILCMLLPLISKMFMYSNDLEFAWYFSENYKVYELVHEAVYYFIFITGVALLWRNESTVAIYMSMFGLFLGYQILVWQLEDGRYDSSLSINESYRVALVQRGGGALGSYNGMQIEVYKKINLFLFTRNRSTFLMKLKRLKCLYWVMRL